MMYPIPGLSTDHFQFQVVEHQADTTEQKLFLIENDVSLVIDTG